MGYRHNDEERAREAAEADAAEANLRALAAVGDAKKAGALAPAPRVNETQLLRAVSSQRSPKWERNAWTAAVLGSIVSGVVGGLCEAAPMSMAVFACACGGWVFGVIWVYTQRIEPRLARQCLEAERAFVNALPFTVDGYFVRISEMPAHGRTRINVELVERCPERPVLEGVLAIAESSLLASDRDAARFVAQGPKLCATTDKYRGRSNAPVMEWQRRLVREVLLPLHAAARIGRVQLLFDK